METLSDKIEVVADALYPEHVILAEDVKEFIQLLKEELSPKKFNNKRKVFLSINDTIDKFAGKKLIWEKNKL